MDILKRLRAGFMGEHILKEAADEIDRLRQQNAELIEALQRFSQSTVGNEILEKLESKDSVFVQLIKHARKVLAKATGGE